ncbi:hypothetical protein EBU71_17990 [bacterium]|nr:hypothetical protein [Candidatus Elulimicrobium humile]
MSDKLKTPIIREDLITYLNSLFPDKCPDLKDSEKEIYYKSGQRSVVNHLINQFNIQQEN